MKKILAIGNSFSQDATTYLHPIAAQAGMPNKVVNLYIGGCSLQTHWENAEQDLPNYEYQLNGESLDRFVSIKEALLEDDWDFIVMQQVSGDSGIEQTYFPYIQNLSNYVDQYCKHAKKLIHQTWAYEIDSSHEDFAKYNHDQLAMYRALKSSYEKAAQALGGLEIIPCGHVIQTLRALEIFDYAIGGRSLCRDGFHMDLVYGRYALAATWFECVFGGNILENGFMPPQSDKGLIGLIKQTVHDVCRLSCLRGK